MELIDAFYARDDAPPPGGEAIEIVTLDQEHPGFRDAAYRARRNEIARLAMAWKDGDPLPDVPYSDAEHAVWAQICQLLIPQHEARVASPLAMLHRVMVLDRQRIPVFADVNAELAALTGFRLRPVAGLVSLRSFLSRLGRRQFVSTQYIRHASQPLYTPEPDVVHELLGHAVSLAHPVLAFVHRLFGWAAELADDTEIQRLGSVYWYALEFGACREAGEVRAVGAGLMSSCGELADFDRRGELRPWDLEAIAGTPFDPTQMQPFYFVAPSFDAMLSDLSEWVLRGGWRAR